MSALVRRLCPVTREYGSEIRVAKKAKSKYILVRMVSEAGTGCSYNIKRLRLQDKLVMLSYDRFVKQKVLFKEQKKICSV